MSAASRVIGVAAAGVATAWKVLGEGAELELARSRFDALAASIGATSEALLVDLREATAGMQSDAQLMSSAAQIISLGLFDTQEDVVRLARVIGELGLDMGQVILTFANNSKLRLDALGLAISDVDERTQKFLDAGHEMDQAFDLAVLEALEARLELIGSAADTTAGDMRQLEADMQNMKDATLEWIAVTAGPAIHQMAGGYNEDLQMMIDAQMELVESSEDLIEVGQRLANISYFEQWAAGTLHAVQDAEEEVVRGLAAMSGSAEEFQDNLQEAFGDRAFIEALDLQIASLPEVARLYADLTRETNLNAAAQNEARRTWQDTGVAIGEVSEALLTYENRREGILSQEGIELRLAREAEEARDLASALREAKEELDGLNSSQRSRGLRVANKELTGVAAAAANAAENVGGFLTDAFEEARRATDEAQRAADAYWRTIENITSSALGSQFNLINDVGDTREEIERLRDAVEANPDDIGLVNDLENAIDRFHELTGEASESWEDMVLGIIMETGGFDQVAADFAVASGIMTQAQADAQLGAVQMAEALESIGLAIDQGAVTPGQGAEIFNTILSGADNAEEAIAQAQAMLDELTGGGIDLSAGGAGGIPPQIAGAIEGTDTLNTALLAVESEEWTVTVDDTQVTTALDSVAMLEEALLAVGETTTTVNIPAIGGGGIGHASGTGGWRTVPSGFPNDTFPAFLSSGESYNVVPAGQQPQGQGQRIDARTFIIPNTKEAMALAMASAGEGRKRRGDSYMGRR